MAYNVMDVARFVINYGNDKGYIISNLKLQKILYFIQVHFLAFTPSHKPCFNEDIEAWNFGPVIPEVYHEFKQFGSGKIPPIKEYYDFSNGVWDIKLKSFSEDLIDSKDREIIISMVDLCSQRSASDLVRITHDQAPWKSAYRPYQNNVISKESILSYFKKD